MGQDFSLRHRLCAAPSGVLGDPAVGPAAVASVLLYPLVCLFLVLPFVLPVLAGLLVYCLYFLRVLMKIG